MMKAAFCTNLPSHIKNVYSKDTVSKIKMLYDLDETIICKKNINNNLDIAATAEVLFSTWGMEHFEKEKIKKYFPNLKYIFYAAGSVQHFAKEFLEEGIKVFSANAANAVPVAEYTFAQIVLTNKGMFGAIQRNKLNFGAANHFCNQNIGNYHPKIGIVGVGKIGSMVIELLKNIDCEIYYYDPFLPKETAEKLGIKELTLEEIFKTCDCISNHLANKEELTGVFGYKLFSLMKPYATFINTGRGRQVDEKGLVKALSECKTRTALLDVTMPEPPHIFSKLRRMKNIILTPHIAGSSGKEVARMGDYMLNEAEKVSKNLDTDYEVTLDMLKTMA